MIYSSGDNGLKYEPMPIYGTFISQSTGSEVYKIDFIKGFNIAKVDKTVNIQVQWVHHNQCTYLKKGVVPK
jgi:hypothetical protein